MFKRLSKVDVREGILYFSVVVSVLLLLLYFTAGRGFAYHLPLVYGGDAITSQVFIKTILDTGWFFSNPFLGAPFGYSLADYPMSEAGNFLLMKLLGLFTKKPVLVMHNFLFTTYFLAALTSLYVFRYLGLNRLFAFAGSLLFSFLGYHFYRGESHLLLSAYYAVPVYIFFALAVFQDQFFTSNDTKTLWAKGLLCILVLAFCASTGVYYAFFGAYFILIAGILTAIDKKSWQPLLRAGFLGFVISGAVFMNILPSFISVAKEGKNLETAQRHFMEAELYGLKISYLLLPDHHGPLGRLKKKYTSSAPLVNENAVSELGMFGGIGFLFLLGAIFLRRAPFSNLVLFNLSRLNLSGILLATIGGIGSLFALLISSKIRGYNRISVFIAFFSLAAFFLVLQKILENRSQFWRRIVVGVVVFLCVVSILLGASTKAWSNIKNKAVIESDQAFVNEIEKQIPHGMVFQLPVMPFPEQGAIHKMHDYEPFRGYLHSKTLKWSYGAMRGRMPLEWQQSVALAPEAEMLKQLAYAGFSGIYINRKGYLDHGVNLERNLKALLNQNPIVSQDRELVFYPLTNYVRQLHQSLPRQVWDKNVLQVKNIGWRWSKGWDSLKVSDHSAWRWSLNKGKSVLEVANRGQTPLKIRLQAEFSAKDVLGLNLNLSGDLIKETIHVSTHGTVFKKDIIIKPGRHFIYFQEHHGQPFSLKVSHFSINVLEPDGVVKSAYSGQASKVNE